MPFEIVNQGDYHLIKLIGFLKGDEKPSLLDSIQGKMAESPAKHIIVHCGECGEISLLFVRQLAQVYKEVKERNGIMRLIQANDALKKMIEANGLDRILIPRASLRGALVDMGLASNKELDVNFINPFLNSTLKVLKIQCQVDARHQKPYLKRPNDPRLLGDISGIIAISSEAFSGTLAISMAEKVFLRCVNNMLGEEATGITEENVDLIGELANIILGQTKAELNELGYVFQMTLPSCIWGKDHKIKQFGTGLCMVIPFETDDGIVFVEVMTGSLPGEAISG
jgi:chemotaxis protein CheX